MNETLYAVLYSIYTVIMAVLLVFLGERWQNRLYLDEGWSGFEEDNEQWSNP